MTKIALVGACGKMGRMIVKCAQEMPAAEIVAGVDTATPSEPCPFPMYKSLDEVTEHVDVLIDFSSPNTLDSVLKFCQERNVPAVLAATGYTPEQKAAIRHATMNIPIFQSSNYSIGVCLLQEMAKRVAQVMRGCDIEIIEKHHKKKADAPSGTALTLADTIASVISGEPVYVYGRHGRDTQRKANEIGIHSIRGGELVGEHEVLFLSEEEEVDLVHKAYSRRIFAEGALAAAFSVIGKAPSIYGMPDLLRTMALVPGRAFV